MKSFSFVVLFAAAAINFMGVDVRTVEIAQAQMQAERTMMADDVSQAAPVLVAAR